MAGHISYLDTGVVHNLLEHLDTDIADFLNNTQYSPIISKLFSLVENNELPMNNSGFGVDRRKKKSYTIMRKEENQADYSCAIIPLKEEIWFFILFCVILSASQSKKLYWNFFWGKKVRINRFADSGKT